MTDTISFTNYMRKLSIYFLRVRPNGQRKKRAICHSHIKRDNHNFKLYISKEITYRNTNPRTVINFGRNRYKKY